MSLEEYIIQQEQERLKRIIAQMRIVLFQEQDDRHKLNLEITELKQQKLDTSDWREKQEITERIAECRSRYNMRCYQDGEILRRPYFGVLELNDDQLGNLSYCLGAQTFFDQNSRVLVIDWREAPISRLYYEYNAGEIYDEDIQNQERSGIIHAKRQVDTTSGVLRKISENGNIWVCDEHQKWQKADHSSKSIAGKEQKADHRLPEITALISSEQFQTIAREDAGAILLQGGAGSGKTTVGLHRIAYLTYQYPERFTPHRMLVVMFNRSLQRYISGILPELGVKGGINTETYHSWAARLFRQTGMNISYNNGTPPEIALFKKSRIILPLTDLYLQDLLRKSRTWFSEQLAKHNDPEFKRIRNMLRRIRTMDGFIEALNTHSVFSEAHQPEARTRIRAKMLARLSDHLADIHGIFTEPELFVRLFDQLQEQCGEQYDIRVNSDKMTAWQNKLREKNQLDFADTGILLWLMQRKGIKTVLPEYAHIMVDEAQDLSVTELATLVYAADKNQSLTICGDMAQKIKDDVSFGHADGFADVIRSIQERIGAESSCTDTLSVGYRATRQIMAIARHVINAASAMTVPRDGEPVEILRTQNSVQTLEYAANILNDYAKKRPHALTGVVCRYKADANQIYNALTQKGVINLRRHQREDFIFQPGIIVTNAHQVKGLEFSAVMIINPCSRQYRDNPESRMLLHMVITRASDRLWIIGHEPMAYGIEGWGDGGN